ncbi:MAG: transcription termination factor Rho [Gemmatimonadaceae bacterium]|nr:transcription termination factor Rho [Gemmatimonadaceae bacterium]
MTEPRRPSPGRGPRSPRKTAQGDEPNPYKDSGDALAAVKTPPKTPTAKTKAVADDEPVKKPRGRPKKTVVADAAPTEVRVAAPAPVAAIVTPVAPPPQAPPAPRVESAPSESASFDSGAERAAPSPERSGERPDRNADRNTDRNGDRNEKRGRFQRRRGRGRNRFRDGVEGGETAAPPQNPHNNAPRNERGPRPERNDRPPRNERHERGPRPERQDRQERQGRPDAPETPGSSIVTAEATITGWYDPARGDGGFIRRGAASYLPQPGDPFIPGWMARQFQLRRADLITGAWGHDQRRRPTVCEISTINDMAPDPNVRRKDFKSLTASYPDKRLTLETGRPAKVGHEITRRALDLIAPIGYGQRALIVAPARAGKTTLLQAITEGVHLNHPNAVLMLLLVDERPEEVSEAISWDVGEVIASSFDQPAQRHVDVTEIVTERAHRLVEMGKDVVIVLDSITRMGRAFNTANRGTGRTMSGGLDANAMAKPKAFFGSARNVAPEDGGGSLTIIATALVETGSRMDDVIFEEFMGTGNCEIKLDRGLAERRIFPAIDIPASGTRREEKLYKPEQVQSIYMLRRGLQQMPPMGAMEWLIKRISATANNDALLAGL